MMFVILSYDIGEKRVKKAAKIAKKYLFQVQRSLFQGYITEKQLAGLKCELDSIIDYTHDTVIIYKAENENNLTVDEIGIVKIQNSYIL